MKIQTINELIQSHGCRLLIYGKPGSGKTMLACTAPKPLLLSIEGGTLSLRKENMARVFGKEILIPSIRVSTSAEMDEVIKKLENTHMLKKFQTIFIDSLSEYAQLVVAEKKAQYADGRKAYGEANDKVMDIVRRLFKLQGIHIVATAKFADKDVMTFSMPTTSLHTEVGHLFDIIMLARKSTIGKTSRYVLKPHFDEEFDAKDRSGVLAKTERPNIRAIITKLLENTSKEK